MQYHSHVFPPTVDLLDERRGSWAEARSKMLGMLASLDVEGMVAAWAI